MKRAPYRFLHQDDQNTVVAVSDPAGDAIEYYAYTPYGQALVFQDPPGAAKAKYGDSSGGVEATVLTSLTQPLMYLGRPYDVESDWYNVRNRYMSPHMGRFVSQDPLGIWGDEANMGNAYALLADSPLWGVDPYGERAYPKVIQGEVPARPRAGVILVENFISEDAALGLRGDGRDFDVGPNPDDSRIAIEIDWPSGRFAARANPTCETNGDCHPPYQWGDGNNLDVTISGDLVTFRGSFKQSAHQPKWATPAIDIELKFDFSQDGQVYLGLKRDGFPSMEIALDERHMLFTAEEQTPGSLYPPMEHEAHIWYSIPD